MLKFYGKKSCITCQKALAFLDANGVAYENIPIETCPPSQEILAQLVDPANVKASLNARSAIYKAQNMGKQTPDKATALSLMLQDPNLIKRPVIMTENGVLYQGFEPDSLQVFLKAN